MLTYLGAFWNPPPAKFPVQAAIASLRSVLSCPALENVLASFSDPTELLKLENTDYSTTVQNVHMTHTVIGVWFSGKSFLNSMRCLGPSFFLHETGAACERHVQILEDIGGKRFCLLLCFQKEPYVKEIEVSLEVLRRQLKIPRSRRVISTSVLHLPKNKHLFRLDGSCIRNKASRKISVALRDVIVNQKQTYQDPTLQITSQGREPLRWVFVLRQSQEDSAPTKTSIPRQLWTMLTSKNAPFRRLEELDEISVVIELCSSHKHPIQDRMVFRDLPDDLPLIFLTTNPDRLTRRDNKIDLILERGEWYTRGLHGNNLNWVNVRQHKAAIEEQVNIGK